MIVTLSDNKPILENMRVTGILSTRDTNAFLLNVNINAKTMAKIERPAKSTLPLKKVSATICMKSAILII